MHCIAVEEEEESVLKVTRKQLYDNTAQNQWGMLEVRVYRLCSVAFAAEVRKREVRAEVTTMKGILIAEERNTSSINISIFMCHHHQPTSEVTLVTATTTLTKLLCYVIRSFVAHFTSKINFGENPTVAILLVTFVHP